MTTQTLLPPLFWFKLALACPRVEDIPQLEAPNLLGLPESCRLPNLAGLAAGSSSVEVRAAWNEAGLGLEFRVELSATDKETASLSKGREKPARQAANPPAQPVCTVDLWLDTRDTRDVSRPTRFCHRFLAVIEAQRKGLQLAYVKQMPLMNAVGYSAQGKPETRHARLHSPDDELRLELFLEAGGLTGFDPDTNRRLGFSYRVQTPRWSVHQLGLGQEFTTIDNPSLWPVLALVD